MTPLRLLAALLALAAACATRQASPPPASAARAAPAAADLQALNRAAVELALPLLWTGDADGDGAVDARELAVVWGLDARLRSHWVKGDALTPAFHAAWARVQAHAAAPAAAPGEGAEAARQAALRRELSQSYFTAIETDLSSAPAADRAMVGHLLQAARVIERLYARQQGVLGMAERIPEGDTLSRAVFFLNQGPHCSAPATEKDPACSALWPAPPRRTGLYPAALQERPGFCDALHAAPGAAALTSPFTVVVEEGGALRAVPYVEAWREDMAEVARLLRAAAAAASPDEAALRTYLGAAANAFETGDWPTADEAWARMGVHDSRWYLRVAPDEVYHEPCSLKAGFHLTLARIDRSSLAWQRRLEPVKGAMEEALAALAGPPYRARAVAFHLPDFIEIVLNSGDSRAPRGATIGQSLPNWGAVANEGRGRTVAMTNLYQDPESKRVARARAESLFCPAVMARWADDQDTAVMGTVLHEAAHNLGPSHAYAVDGKTDDAIFGGPLASTLEELKAQTSALYLTDWLAARGVVDRALAERSHVANLAWTFGHVARGMYDAQGKIKPYSALAAIQLGALLDSGALAWRAEAAAANGADRGCLEVDHARLPAAIEALERRVLGVKARGDVADARALVAAYVDGEGPFADFKRTVTERYNRHPVATFLYAVRE